MTLKQRLLLFATVAAITVVSAVILLIKPEPREKVVVGDASIYTTEKGIVNRGYSFLVEPEVGGKIKEVHVNVGDEVEEGEKIVTLEYPNAYEANASKALIEGYKSEVRSIQKALLEEGKEERDFPYTWQYYDALAKAEQARLDKIEADAKKYVIQAPVSGIIRELPASVKQIATAGQNLAEIWVNTGVVIRTEVMVNEAESLKEGDAVSISRTLKNNTENYSGTISNIDIEAKADSNGDSRITVSVEPPENFPPAPHGSDCSVTFTILEQTNRLIVPNTAIVKEGDETYVYKFVKNKKVKTKVELGRQLGTNTVVAGGLASGDYVQVADNVTK